MDSNSDASNHSSSPSPSPAQLSPSESLHAEPSLQRLTAHFVQAKRSLTTTHHVFRANKLVTSARALVEEIAVLHARNDFASLAAEDGIEVLERVRWAMQSKGEEAGADFDRVIGGLDEANGRLMATLKKLGAAVVDASLQRRGGASRPVASPDEGDPGAEDDERAAEEERTLLSFIDTSKHESIQASLRAQIDDFNAAHGDLANSLDTFAAHLNVFHSMLSPPPSSPEPPPELLRPTLYDEPPPTVPQLFHSITDNAATMASLLQSLISHYDLCVTALKHTEGGGQAAKQAVQHQQQSPSASASGSKENLEESLYTKPHASPISADERQEMLRVLEHDSEEVEDVVAELAEHARDLEGSFDKLAIRARKARERDQTLRKVVAMMHEMHDIHLPSHSHGLRTFEQDWLRIRSAITDSMAQLEELSDFYADFLEGYKRLLREVERRSAAEAQMRKIADKAARDIGKVYEADAAARRTFMDEVGSVLPGDMWPALQDEGRRWRVVEVEGAGEDG